jgi:hypothetical protein
VSGCWWCGSEDSRLCDVLIGCERRKSDNTLIHDEAYLCSAEFCMEHGRQLGHISGEEPDTIDACCEHGGLSAVPVRELAASAEASERVRRNIRAKALRQRMRLVR